MTTAETVEPALGPVNCTVGGAVEKLLTVVRTTGDVPMRPAESVVWAANQWAPSGTVVVSQASAVRRAGTTLP